MKEWERPFSAPQKRLAKFSGLSAENENPSLYLGKGVKFFVPPE